MKHLLLPAALLLCIAASCTDATDNLPLLPDTPASTEDLCGQPIQIGSILSLSGLPTYTLPGSAPHPQTRARSTETDFPTDGTTLTVLVVSPTPDAGDTYQYANYTYQTDPSSPTPSGTWQIQPGSQPLTWQSSTALHRFYAVSPALPHPTDCIRATGTGPDHSIRLSLPISLPTTWTADAYHEYGDLRTTPGETSIQPTRSPIPLSLHHPLVRMQVISSAQQVILRQVNTVTQYKDGTEQAPAKANMNMLANGLMHSAYILPYSESTTAATGTTDINFIAGDKAYKSAVENSGLGSGSQVQINMEPDVATVNSTAGAMTQDWLTSNIGNKKKVVITGEMNDEDIETLGYFVYNNNITDICIVATGVTSIGRGVFGGCSSLKSIILPEGITSIWGEAFTGCSSLESITLPKGLTTIGENAFEYCDMLKSITLPEGLTSIGRLAFSTCISLTDITLPKGIKSIGDNAFVSCYSLTSISLPDNLTSIERNAFSDCTSLTSINLPNNLIRIETGLFFHCTSLTSISLPDNLTSIGYAAFSDCTSLQEVTLSGINDQFAFFLPTIEDEVFENTSPTTLFLRDIDEATFNAHSAACQTWGGITWQAIHYGYNGADDDTDASNYSGHWFLTPP